MNTPKNKTTKKINYDKLIKSNDEFKKFKKEINKNIEINKTYDFNTKKFIYKTMLICRVGWMKNMKET